MGQSMKFAFSLPRNVSQYTCQFFCPAVDAKKQAKSIWFEVCHPAPVLALGYHRCLARKCIT